MADQKFCPRCGKVGVKTTVGGFDLYNCPDHKLIWKQAVAAKAEPAKANQPAPAQPAAAQASKARKLN